MSRDPFWAPYPSPPGMRWASRAGDMWLEHGEFGPGEFRPDPPSSDNRGSELRPPPVPSTGHVSNGQPPVSRIPHEAIAAVERVLASRADAVAEVPGSERWRSTTVTHQCVKTLSHAEEAINGVEADRDTGEHPLAHAAARALLGLALALQRKDPR